MIPATSPQNIDYSKFIYFHPSTKGDAGRKVFIDKQLITRFIEVAGSQSNCLLLLEAMVKLKSSAAGIGSNSNQACASQHSEIIKNLYVTYSVLQQGGKGAGVYITNIHQAFSGDVGRPGLYKVSPGGMGGWTATADDSGTMTSSVGVLGALPPEEDGVAVSLDKTAKVLITHVTDHFTASARDRQTTLTSNGHSGRVTMDRLGSTVALFYAPAYEGNGIGWITSGQKASGGVSVATAFARLLAKTESQATSNNHGEDQRYKWYIVGHGAKVFLQALNEYKTISRHPLKRSHDIYFVDPQIPLTLLEQGLMDQGVDFYRDRNVLSSTMTLAAQINQVFDEGQSHKKMHRAWERAVALNSSLREVESVLNPYKAPVTPLCFSELIKKLATALVGRW